MLVSAIVFLAVVLVALALTSVVRLLLEKSRERDVDVVGMMTTPNGNDATTE